MKHLREGAQPRPTLNRHISIPKECLNWMAKTTKSFLALMRGGNLGVPLVILCILAMVILPLPACAAGYSVHLQHCAGGDGAAARASRRGRGR
ncbi:lateral flagellar export/assembly protein (FlhA-like) [Escherichia coli]|uniref:Lateral flagellar export/assembly protein (FlhA-like) n=1 Tax=Escherichia coli TaxID=562 RepID=A0A377DHS8_ECOLX|nr:lateral flagellar export/assembly protein (FlhA-like) [Escherichia coli]